MLYSFSCGLHSTCSTIWYKTTCIFVNLNVKVYWFIGTTVKHHIAHSNLLLLFIFPRQADIKKSHKSILFWQKNQNHTQRHHNNSKINPRLFIVPFISVQLQRDFYNLHVGHCVHIVELLPLVLPKKKHLCNHFPVKNGHSPGKLHDIPAREMHIEDPEALNTWLTGVLRPMWVSHIWWFFIEL